MSKPKKVSVLNINPSNVVIRYKGENREIRMSKQFFKKRIEMGILEVEDSLVAKGTI